MGPVLLVAASGLAREVLAALRATDPDVEVAVVDDDPSTHGTSLAGAEVVGGLDDVTNFADRAVVVCAGRGAARRSIVERLTLLGLTSASYATVVHPSVHVPAGCSVGAGTVLLAGTVLTADVVVGEHVVVMPHVTLTHDDVVEDYATLCAGVTLGGTVRIGLGAYVGMSASVRENLTVGHDAVLGMGAVLLADLPAGERWVGVPASPILDASSLPEA